MLDAPSTPKWCYMVIFQILSHLARYESSAVAVVEANVLNSVEKFLRSRPTDLYEHIFPMLGSLLFHESTATSVLDMCLCDFLATLWHGYTDGRRLTRTIAVINLLFHIARWREGAEGMVTAKSLDNIRRGLQSHKVMIRLSACRLLRELVGHESTVQAVVAIVPREDIVALLSEWDDDVRECAVATLQILDATLARIDIKFHN
ncbi:hypothetical protein C8J57DRAFT_1312129 [Mycena rebaudengoi]|nr:hypothetical protein C8J57DRAFT_1312129 [Mycena rebaudengoi]